MIGKLILIALILVTITFIIIIVVYNNFRPKTKTFGYEHMVQFDSHKCPEDVFLNYISNQYTNTSIIVTHHPKPPKIVVKGKYYLLNSHTGKLPGYHTIYREKHHIFINKRYYIITNQKYYTIHNADITKIVCINTNFQHIQFILYVCTLKQSESYFETSTYTNVLNVMKFIISDAYENEFVLMADFECQNWEFLRLNVMQNVNSSGSFDICTRQIKNELSSPHGIIFSKDYKLSFVIDVNYIDILYVKNIMISIVKCVHNGESKFTLGNETIKLTSALNSQNWDENFMSIKKVPNIADIDKEYKVETDERQIQRFITIDSVLNHLLKHAHENV